MEVYMGKISPRSLSEKQRAQHSMELIHALKTVKRKELPEFILHLLAGSEKIMINRRIAIAKKLLMGHSFLSIRNELHVGLTTIENVHRWLSETYPDYRVIIPKLYNEEFAKWHKKQHPPEPLSMRWLFKKYPLHFWIYTLILDELAFEKEQREKQQGA
jgi:uncharacterized protein YerC